MMQFRIYKRMHSTGIQYRKQCWDVFQSMIPKPNQEPITIKCHQHLVQGTSGITSPLHLLQDISLPKQSYQCAYTLQHGLVDLSFPLTQSDTVYFLPSPPSSSLDQGIPNWDSIKEKEVLQHVLWHSSSHVLGYALESMLGDDVFLENGPALKEGMGGFYYDGLVTRQGSRLVEQWVQPLSLLNQDASVLYSHSQRILSKYPHMALELLSESQHHYTLSDSSLKSIENKMKSIISDKLKFERMVLPKHLAVLMFATNPFKLGFISSIPDDASISIYRCGDFIDLCKGPHLPHTGFIKAMELVKMSRSKWNLPMNSSMDHQIKQQFNRLHQTDNPLVRVYGISFKSKSELSEWRRMQQEAEKRDHRIIGKQQALFTFHPMSPGSAFMLPHGTRIMNTLMNVLRHHYKRLGYHEIVTPLLFNKDVWKTSGHWENYRDDMFIVSQGSRDQQETVGVKPMNCPGHCLVFSSASHSYKDLPIRYAEFSPLHRNEASGALTGLTRVRKFHQDDAHIFCTLDQLSQEIQATLKWIDNLYRVCFQFESYTLALSTRPEKGFLGEAKEWDKAEETLKHLLKEFVKEKQRDSPHSVAWTVKQGDGAFYGPKIDILVKDALNRQHQLGTIQLDFQLPKRFDLKYQAQDGSFATPVMIHRAVLGSVERMMAVLIEHFGGKWPFWINPRQVMILNVDAQQQEYAREVAETLASHSFYVDVDDSDRTLSKRMYEAQSMQYSFILVVGERERQAKTVSVRPRSIQETTIQGEKNVDELIHIFKQLNLEYK